MEDKTKKYKGIKFLNVGQQFLGVEKTKKYSSNALSINHNFPMFNKVDTLRSSGKNSAKSSLYEIRSINTKKSQEKSNKKSENNDIEVLKKLIEIKKEEERLSKENPNINIKLKTDKLIKKSLSSKNLKDLKNKIISFKSIIINNINNTNNVYNNIKGSSQKNIDKICSNIQNTEKKADCVKKEHIRKKTSENKLKKCFCCL